MSNLNGTRQLLQGNEAIVHGALTAGCRFFAGYPITPATEIAERMSKLTAIPHAAIVGEIERTSKSHYSYTMATQMIGEKPTFLIRRWIGEADQDYQGAKYDSKQ